MRILFVCTANECRSPTAERLARMLGADAASAGVRAINGRPVVPAAAKALAELGADPSDFSSRRITPAIVTEADLVLTMTVEHRDAVLMVNPSALRRTFTLSEAVRLIHERNAATVADLHLARPFSTAEPDEDILDPMGHPYAEFQSAATRILDLTRVVVDRLHD
ncbi:MAG: low molecular weight phosphatase family protein [Nocardiaceae bacterium]|nr:low molecular weight phosphatase family protein [Nocardiaceae bacterium]